MKCELCSGDLYWDEKRDWLGCRGCEGGRKAKEDKPPAVNNTMRINFDNPVEAETVSISNSIKGVSKDTTAVNPLMVAATIVSVSPDLDRGEIGAMGELRVSADLIARGYYVFRNLSPTGPFDLAAYRNGKLLRIEVRSGLKHKRSNRISWGTKSTDECDHYAVYLKHEHVVFYYPELPTD